MEYIKLQYSKKDVNRAGQVLKEGDFFNENYIWAQDVLTNWRSLHSYPINTFQATLRVKLKKIDKDAFVAQRLKRAPSIIAKLERSDSMQLSRMQDIAGLRAVVKNLETVEYLRQQYHNSKFLHELITEKDYISIPKSTGYRGIHLVYKYYNKKVPFYNGLRIELQIRTKLQHSWATAVETAGTFLNHALKSSEGPSEWLDFFALAGSAFAHLENSAPLERFKAYTREEIYERVLETSARLEIEKKLSGFTVAANKISSDQTHGHYHLVVLNLDSRKLRIYNYGRRRLNVANSHYTEIEKRINEGQPLQVVLVSAGSIEALRKAYPNYFLDTRSFVGILNQIRKSISIKK